MPNDYVFLKQNFCKFVKFVYNCENTTLTIKEIENFKFLSCKIMVSKNEGTCIWGIEMFVDEFCS